MYDMSFIDKHKTCHASMYVYTSADIFYGALKKRVDTMHIYIGYCIALCYNILPYIDSVNYVFRYIDLGLYI